MFRARQRRLAWMFLLVLAMELALFCCASVHLAGHACGGHRGCAICAYARAGLRRAALSAVALPALCVAAIRACARLSRRLAVADSPVLRRVRLND